MAIYQYQRFLALQASPETVAEFFSDVRHLDTETPAHFRLHLLQGEVGTPLKVGQRFHYQFRLFGVPFPWTTEILAVTPEGFTDIQARGPFQEFAHEHTFIRVPHGTLMLDQIRYRLPFGPLNPAVNTLFVKPILESIFDFRAARACQRFGTALDNSTHR